MVIAAVGADSGEVAAEEVVGGAAAGAMVVVALTAVDRVSERV
jgi:hypothetical protein